MRLVAERVLESKLVSSVLGILANASDNYNVNRFMYSRYLHTSMPLVTYEYNLGDGTNTCAGVQAVL